MLKKKKTLNYLCAEMCKTKVSQKCCDTNLCLQPVSKHRDSHVSPPKLSPEQSYNNLLIEQKENQQLYSQVINKITQQQINWPVSQDQVFHVFICFISYEIYLKFGESNT